MLYNEKQIPELNVFYHRNDDVNKNYMDYENVLLNKTLSSYIYSNDTMSIFLNKLNKLVSLFFDQFNIIKNMKNFTVDKYYYKHTK
jgi:hypothetical protein